MNFKATTLQLARAIVLAIVERDRIHTTKSEVVYVENAQSAYQGFNKNNTSTSNSSHHERRGRVLHGSPSCNKGQLHNTAPLPPKSNASDDSPSLRANRQPRHPSAPSNSSNLAKEKRNMHVSSSNATNCIGPSRIPVTGKLLPFVVVVEVPVLRTHRDFTRKLQRPHSRHWAPFDKTIVNRPLTPQ